MSPLPDPRMQMLSLSDPTQVRALPASLPPDEAYRARVRAGCLSHAEARQMFMAELLAIPGFRAMAERFVKDHAR